MKFHMLFLAIMALIVASSCQKKMNDYLSSKDISTAAIDSTAIYDSLQTVQLTNRISGPSVGAFQSDRAYNLNIVYFIPSDVQPAAGFQRRLSELMLWTQDWFKAEMAKNGYTNQTFGLYTNAERTNVRFNIIFGTKDKTQYAYDGGSGNVLAEVNAFYAAHPQLKSSDHNLIILPSFYVQSNGVPGGGPVGPPFYGLGRNCFALDYADMDLVHKGNNTTALGKAFITWFGGMVHELGHGLNLPHNRQKVSEGSDTTKGMALMWAGNSTLGLSPTFLTGADAAVLHVNQVFNTNTAAYYGAVTASLPKLRAFYDATKNAIILNGRYTSTGNVTSVLCFNDPNVNNEGTGVNRDYNAIAWAFKPIGVDSFYMEMPISELVEKANGMTYEAKIKLVHDNGVVREFVYMYSFMNGIPVIDFGTKNFYSKTGWQIIDFSSQEISTAYPGQATRAIDGSFDTYWHTNWSQTPTATAPHHITIDMLSSRVVGGISLWQRRDSNAGRTANAIIYSSTDAVNWTENRNVNMQNSTAQQDFSFTNPLQARYIKIVVPSQSQCSLAEVSVY